MKDQAARFPAIDAFKAIASQLIVLHHLAAYGPLSDAVQQAAPGLISLLYDHARMAVQLFIVIGGYLSARTLFPSGGRYAGSLATAICNRYLRLAVPYVTALAFSVICAMAARHWLSDDFAASDFIPGAPTWSQLLAHVLLLQSLLEFDSLSAGVWYIAIDFQLFLLMVGLLWIADKTSDAGNLVPSLVTLMAVASLFWFNRDPHLDSWAPYFFGAYGMGAAAYWAGQRVHRSGLWLGVIASMAVISLLVDFRARIAVALAAALMLFFARKSQRMEQWASNPLLHYLGKISYSLFLMHFPILLLANALFNHLGLAGPVAGSIGMLAAWATSLLVADLFYRKIEQPASTLKAHRVLKLWQVARLKRTRLRFMVKPLHRLLRQQPR